MKKARFKANDVIVMNNQRMVVTYWPADNEGYFTAEVVRSDKGKDTFTYHTSQYKESEAPLSDVDIAATGVANRGGSEA